MVFEREGRVSSPSKIRPPSTFTYGRVPSGARLSSAVGFTRLGDVRTAARPVGCPRSGPLRISPGPGPHGKNWGTPRPVSPPIPLRGRHQSTGPSRSEWSIRPRQKIPQMRYARSIGPMLQSPQPGALITPLLLGRPAFLLASLQPFALALLMYGEAAIPGVRNIRTRATERDASRG